jgi:uncharacterized SAM-binding protein YcdF (DUF218 family)
VPRPLTAPPTPDSVPPRLRQRQARRLHRDVTRLVIGSVIALIALGTYATWRIWDQGDRDEQRPSDAIVVLGAAQYDGRPSPVLRARLEHAVELYKAGVAPLLIVTGGKREGDRTTEAAAARRFAISAGVDPAAILVEDRGRTTLESLESVGRMLHARNLDRAVFVSDRTHMLRVLRIARDQGLVPYGSPTATSPTDRTVDRRVDATIHELGALAVYFVTGGQTASGPQP